jgi:FkbM family methyltransferase
MEYKALAMGSRAHCYEKRMKATYNGIEVNFEIRPGSTDANLIKHIWVEDCYRLKSLRKEHPEIGTILDIGGHIGVFSILASLLWPSAEIRAYEAWLENYALLIDHCNSFPKIKTFNIAIIGWKTDSVSFRIPHLSQGNTGDGRIDNKFMDNAHFTEGTTTVSACTIEDVLKDWNISSVDLVKFDCEGSEIPILETLDKTDLIRKIKWIRGEWHGGNANREKIRAILSKTHTMNFDEPKHTYGLFWGGLRDA